MSHISILKRSTRTAAAALVFVGLLKTSIVTLALGIALAGPVAAYANERAYHPAPSHQFFDYWGLVPNGDPFAAANTGAGAKARVVRSPWRDPFKPRTTNGLSRNPDDCASYGCVDSGGG